MYAYFPSHGLYSSILWNCAAKEIPNVYYNRLKEYCLLKGQKLMTTSPDSVDLEIVILFVLGPKHKLPKSKTKLVELNHKTLGSKWSINLKIMYLGLPRNVYESVYS